MEVELDDLPSSQLAVPIYSMQQISSEDFRICLGLTWHLHSAALFGH